MAMFNVKTDSPQMGRSGGGGYYHPPKKPSFWEKIVEVLLLMIIYPALFIWYLPKLTLDFIRLWPSFFRSMINIFQSFYEKLKIKVKKLYRLALAGRADFYLFYLVIPLGREHCVESLLLKESMFQFGDIIGKKGMVVSPLERKNHNFRKDLGLIDFGKKITQYLKTNDPLGVILLDRPIEEDFSAKKIFINFNDIVEKTDECLMFLSYVASFLEDNRSDNLIDKIEELTRKKEVIVLAENQWNVDFKDLIAIVFKKLKNNLNIDIEALKIKGYFNYEEINFNFTINNGVKLKEFISKNQYEMVIAELLKLTQGTKIYDEVVLIGSNAINLEEKIRIGVISNEFQFIEKNKINNNLLQIINRLSEV